MAGAFQFSAFQQTAFQVADPYVMASFTAGISVVTALAPHAVRGAKNAVAVAAMQKSTGRRIARAETAITSISIVLADIHGVIHRALSHSAAALAQASTARRIPRGRTAQASVTTAPLKGRAIRRARTRQDITTTNTAKWRLLPGVVAVLAAASFAFPTRFIGRAIRRTATQIGVNFLLIAQGRLLWNSQPEQAEVWTPVVESPETWAPVSNNNEVWTRIRRHG